MKISQTEVHCHLLPGVDDGFRSAESSLKAIGRMQAEGCCNFIFTPHLNPDVFPEMNEDRLKEVYESFAPAVPSGIKTHLAAEYMVVNGFEEKVASRASDLLTFPDGVSILIEMSYFYRSQNLEQTVFELGIAGLKPIIAHPERYIYMSEKLSDFDRLADMGCRFQMNLLSLTGKYGKESLKILKYLMGKGLYSYAATDLHSNPQLESILDARVPLRYRSGYAKLLEANSELMPCGSTSDRK